MNKIKSKIISVISAGIILQCCSGFSYAHKPLFVTVHYANSLNGLSSGQLELILKGGITNFKKVGGPDRKISIYADKKISAEITGRYGNPAINIRDFSEINISYDKSLLGISGIEGLTPGIKALYIDGRLPWGKINDNYALSHDGEYSLTADSADTYYEKRHITVIQTGVTAMTRAFIPAVERSGDLFYPVRYTMEITKGADISTTSNEVSFMDPCTYPLKNNLVFCSPSRYFQILEKSGFNVIELTGNHNNDFGDRHSLNTIRMMSKIGMRYYGGGIDKNDSEKILQMDVKGVRMSFIGFNEIGPEQAFAGNNRSGAARLTSEKYYETVKKAVSGPGIVFVCVQWGNENNPVPEKKQEKFFRDAADLGATIMVSSSGHRPMGMEFYRGKFISYGLGNFLFDQMQTINHRRGIIARHHFYCGRHIQTELIPYMIHDYCQPRPLHGREAVELMKEIFRYSLGPVFR